MLRLTDAPFLPTWIPTQGMFATETRGERTLLERIHDGVWRPEKLFEDDPHSYT